MSKHHRNNNNQQPKTETVKPAAVEQAAEVAKQAMEALDLPVEETPKAEVVAPAEAPAPVEAEVKPEVKKNLEVAIEKKPVAAPPPAPAVKASAPVAKGYTAEDIYPSQSAFHRNVKAPMTHTPAGQRLINFFDEYDAMMATPTTNKLECQKRVMKLHQVMSAACPAGDTPANVAADLVRIVFDRLNQNWGKLYDESTIFRLDYSLPGGAPAIDKLNVFITAMVELVNSSRSKMRITYVNDRLALVLKNRGIVQAIDRMRQNLERRIENELMR